MNYYFLVAPLTAKYTDRLTSSSSSIGTGICVTPIAKNVVEGSSKNGIGLESA